MVDEDGRVEDEKHHHSAAAAIVGMTVRPDPGRRVGIPVVTFTVRQSPGRCPQRLGSTGALQSPKHGAPNEGGAFARSGHAIHLAHHLVVELYVHSHVHTLAPSSG